MEPSAKKEDKKNPVEYCLNSCGKYLGFKGFCSQKCHDEYYDYWGGVCKLPCCLNKSQKTAGDKRLAKAVWKGTSTEKKLKLEPLSTSGSRTPIDKKTYKCGHTCGKLFFRKTDLVAFSKYEEWVKGKKEVCFNCYYKKEDKTKRRVSDPQEVIIDDDYNWVHEHRFSY